MILDSKRTAGWELHSAVRFFHIFSVIEVFKGMIYTNRK